jgi:hypothetical protein
MQLPGPLSQLDLDLRRYDKYGGSLRVALLQEDEVKVYERAVRSAIMEIGSNAKVVSQLAHGNNLKSDSAVSHKLVTFVVNEKYCLRDYDWLSPTIRRNVAEQLFTTDRVGMLQLLRAIMRLPTGKLLVGSLYQHLVTDELAKDTNKCYYCYKIEEVQAYSNAEAVAEEFEEPEVEEPEVEEPELEKPEAEKETEKRITYRVNQDSKFEVHFPPIKTIHQLQDDAFNQVLELASRGDK